MKNLTLLLSIYILLSYNLSYAQTINSENYLRLEKDYYFCSKTHEMCIPMPAGWGVRLPYINEYEANININSNIISYSIETDNIRSYSIFFSAPGEDEACLELKVSSYYMDEDENENIESEFGTFNILEKHESQAFETYQYNSIYTPILFRILTTKEELKKECRKIIAGAKNDYAVRYDSYFYDSPYNYIETQYIEYYKNDSTYYPELGFTYVIPFDASAEIKAPKIEINEATTLLTAFVSVKELIENEYYAAKFEAPDFDMKYYFIDRNEDKLESFLSEYGYYYTDECQHNFTSSISSIESSVYVFGKRISQIITVTPTKDYYLVLIFSTVNDRGLKHVTDFLSRIKIDENFMLEENNKTTNAGNFYDEMKSWQTVEFSEIKEIKYTAEKLPKNTKTFNVLFPESNVTFTLPVFQEGAIYNNDNLESGTFDEIIKNKKSVDLKKPVNLKKSEAFEGYFNAVVGYDDDYNYFTLGLIETKENETIEERFHNYSDYWECQSSYTITEAGIYNIKAKKWYAISTDSFSVFITEHKGNLFELIIYTSQYSYEEDKASSNLFETIKTLLSKASFK